MTGRIVIATILGLCASMTVGAQTFTQRLQTARQGGATVTVHQDKSIDDLVNGAHLGTTVTPSRVQPAEKSQAVVAPSAKKPSAQNPTEKKPSAQTFKEKKDATHQQPSKDTASHHSSSSADTTAVHPKSGRTYKVMGYRVQAFAGGNSRKDRQKADQIGNELRTLFPTEQVYVHFYSPRWICRMGNYRTYEEALQQLHEVKRLGYTAATIVKGKITVQY